MRGKLRQPGAWWRREPTLKQGDLDILAVHGDSSSVLQLHETVVQGGQPHRG